MEHLEQGLYIDLEKARKKSTTKPPELPKPEGKISRAEAKKVYPDLPPGGHWVTIRGHHVYIVDHKIVAGAMPWMNKKGEVKAKEIPKKHLKLLQAHYDYQRAKEQEKTEKEQAEKKTTTKKTTKAKASKTSATKKTTSAKKTKTATVETTEAKATTKKTTAKATSEEKATKTAKKKATAKATEEKATAKKTTKKKATAEATEEKATKTTKKKASAKSTKKKETAKASEEKAKTTKKKTKAKKDEGKDILRQTIEQNTSEEHKKTQERENATFKEGHDETEFHGKTKISELFDKLSDEWNNGEASKILAKPIHKRNYEDIRRVARQLTEKYEPIALRLAEKMAMRRGINPYNEKNIAKYYPHGGQNGIAITREHPNALNASKKILEGTGIFGDIQQAARASMYEAFHDLLTGEHNTKRDIKKYLISHIYNDLDRDIYELMNHIPTSKEIRPAVLAVKNAEAELAQKLGRTPTDEELAHHLEENYPAFKNAPLTKLPKWDAEKEQWVEDKQPIRDPVEKLHMIRLFGQRQNEMVSADTPINEDGEKEITLQDTFHNPHGESVEEMVERRERAREIREKVPKVLEKIGMTEPERTVWILRHEAPATSGKQRRNYRTDQEVADIINKEYKHLLPNGKPISSKWVNKYIKRAEEKLSQALANKHPALEELRALKSLIFHDMLRTVYLMDLIKSLHAWGLDASVLRKRFTRTAVARNMIELRKSLAPYESIGAFAVTDDGMIHARIVELEIPEKDDLYKSFNTKLNELKKSVLFPHKARSNAALNKKASEYVTKNKQKYKALQEQQLARIRQKQGPLTWSEQLQLEKGGVWITWGGKRILISVENGNIIYDSKNETHREEYNQGAPEDKIEFHHEAPELEEAEKRREQQVREAWKTYYNRVKSKGKSDEEIREEFKKRHRGVDFDEHGNLIFTPDKEVTSENIHSIDHGVRAFQEELHDIAGKYEELRNKMRDEVSHRIVSLYSKLSDEEREKYDNMDEEERHKYIGNYYFDKGVWDVLKQYHNGEISQAEALKKLKEIGDAKKGIDSRLARTERVLKTFLNKVKKVKDLEEARDELAKEYGEAEVSVNRNEASKSFVPEGKYLIGNPHTGKTFVVHIKYGFEGGRAGKGGKFAPVVAEAFDPEGGSHEEIHSWGQLGRALGYTGKEANNLQAILAGSANKGEDKPILKPISDEEFQKYRAKTKRGLQERMLHKNFQLIDEQKDKNGNVIRRVFAQDMPDGTTNIISVDKDGYIEDPIMKRLINQEKPIRTVEDLHEALRKAVGNRTWVTLHFGSDVHIGDALGHHVQLEYDGLGAPRVVGGVYDGYRFIDEKDVPKGAIDPYTGEPVKALFKNGKLVDRRFTELNEVPIEVGNPVLYRDGNRWRKGRIYSEVEGGYKVTDGKGHVIGVFKKEDLRPVKVKGRTLSESGQAVVRLAKTGTHRFNTEEVFKNPFEGKEQLTRKERAQLKRIEKAKQLFAEALRKAKINTNAFDSEGNLKKEIELSDAAMNRLKKVLRRSKLGKELLKQFKSVYKNELELHVPEHLRKDIESEGVRVSKDGIAKISVAKFEQLREALGGLSLDWKAQEFLNDYFKKKDREKPPEPKKLKEMYQPFKVSDKTDFGKHYKALFKTKEDGKGVYVNDPEKGLYTTQLEGVHHMVSRGRVIVGHGMGVGKTVTGVVAHAVYKAKKLAKGEKPKKTLIVAPAGILSEWSKEIGGQTKMKALFIGGSKLQKYDENGDIMRDKKTGRRLFGSVPGTEQEVVSPKHFIKNLEAIGNEDHDFHIVSYDTFARYRDHFANSGLYDNIIIDEVHAFKNHAGKRGQSLAETTDKFENVWGLSGTPMENDAREMWALIDTITGGKHELGSRQEFIDNYMIKDKNGKIVGVKPEKARDLAEKVANVVQFRSANDVVFNDGSKLEFPKIIGMTTPDDPNPQYDFMGNMVDNSHDIKTTDYYGTQHTVVDAQPVEKTAKAKNGEEYVVTTYEPTNNLPPEWKELYDRYKELQDKYLPESKLQELATASAIGRENEGQGKKGSNYLTAVQKLQKFLNAPLAEKMYVPGGNGIDSALDEQTPSDKKGVSALQEYNPETGEGHYIIDENGHKRYFVSDGKGGYLKNEDGSPVLLPPLHHNNPKAQYLKDRIWKYLDEIAQENAERRKKGLPELMPKVVVKSNMTTFGTDIIENVFRDLQREHPELLRWADKLKKEKGKDLTFGSFTGDSDNREETKVGFRGNKNDYANDQGWMWATTVSLAGKEGVDFGNSHLMINYDQDWNPQRMAQFIGRTRRSDSWKKAHQQVQRDNSVRIESLHIPGTVEDFFFNAQDAKMNQIRQIVESTRAAEQNPRYGDTASGFAGTYRWFTRKKKVKKAEASEEPARGGGYNVKAVAQKAIKLVVLV